jgi:5'-deoxynucleotidase YfbR-like HD superfamily hydrolase
MSHDGNEFARIINNPLMKSDNVTRFSGLYQSSPEYLSYHIVDVSTMSYIIARELITKYHCSINVGKLLQRCLVHDADEVLIGDIPRLTKYSSKEVHDKLSELADSTARKMSHDIDSTNYTYDLWSEAKADDIEGWILKIVDILSVSNKTVKEIVYNHNLRFLRVAEESANYIGDLITSLSDKSEVFGEEATTYLQNVLNDDLTLMDELLNHYHQDISTYELINPIISNIVDHRDKE